jgi:O-antigen/teichoic acid export membrane protein
VAVLAGGTALGQAVLIAVSPLLTRLYSPSDIGRFGVFSAAVGVGAVVACLRYEAAIVSADPEDVAPVTALAMALLVPASILAALAVELGAHAGVLGLAEIGPIGVALLCPTLALAGMANVLRFWFIRQQNLRPVSILVVLQNTARAGAQLALGLGKAAWVGLLLGDAIGRASGVAGLARSALREVRRDPQALTRARMSAVALKYRSFSTYFLVSSLIDVVAISLPVPLMAQAFGADTAGQFSLVQRVTAAPVALIAGTFADAFHGRLAALAREAPAAALSLFWRSFRTLLLVALAPTLVLSLLSRQLFPLVFGAQWSEAGAMASLIGPWLLAQFVVGPLSRAVLVYEGQRLKMIYDILALALVVGAFRSCQAARATAVQTVGVLTVVETAAYAVYFLILVMIIRKSTKAR